MLKGLESSLIPFIKRITLEDSSSQMPNNSTQYTEYYNSEANNSDYNLNVKIDFCIKKEINIGEFRSFSNLLSTLSIQTIFIDSRDEFIRFISLQGDKKVEYLNTIRHNDYNLKYGKKIVFSKNNIGGYVSTTLDKENNRSQIISIPFQMAKQYSKGISKANKNPRFLACVYFFTNDLNSIMMASIGAEVIFAGGAKPTTSGYFIIGDTFRYNGVEQALVKSDVLNNNPLVNPATGESLNPNVQIDKNDQANYLFGAPGDMWAGPIHVHTITNQSDNNFGKARIMAGASHNNNIPHPFLKYVVKRNNKIVDLRDIVTFEDQFSYKSGLKSSLSRMKTPIYIQQKAFNVPIDDFIKNKSIFSNCKFSVRPISRQRGANEIQTKDNVILFFGLDKNELLRETTKLPALLDSLTSTNAPIVDDLINNMNISYFEIIRKNKREKSSKTLIIGNNDKQFNDFNAVNQLDKNISKGFSLVNKTNQIYLQNANKKINLYEFTDGELDAFKDDGKYYYKVKVKFRDPLEAYVSDKLRQLDKIIHDLDELLQKISLHMIDSETGRTVKVFDKYQEQLNRSFVHQSLNETAKRSLPLNFSFDTQSELPLSVSEVVKINNDMISFLSAISFMFNNNPFPEDQEGSKKINPSAFIEFIKNSLMLSNTTPMLVEKNRSLFALLRSRVEKILNIYSTEEEAKKSSGFTTRDYLKSSRSPDAIQDGVILEYKHSFKYSLDLSKVNDHFDWIEEAPSEQIDGLKTITNASFKTLIENRNITNYITPDGRSNSDISNLFDYSFLPYSSPAVLDFQKTDKVNLHLNHLQALRKKLTHETANYSEAILIPELLATFGIRFLDSKTNLESYLSDQRSYSATEVPVNNGFEDNFGSEFSSLMRKSGMSSVSFGSVEETETAWAGGNYNNYPSNTASSILNLITTKAFERRNIDFLFNERKNIAENTRIPYATNLFSTEIMSSKDTANTIISDVLDNLFDSNGVMNFEQYSYYSYLLNIFARVYFLKGFTAKDAAAFGNQSNRFTSTSLNNMSFVKDMDWQPLTTIALNSIPLGQTILCKVMLHQDDQLGSLIDTDIINLYKNYYNYNKIFLVKRTGDLITRQETTTTLATTDTSRAPVISSVVSYGAETRSLLDKEIRMLSTIMKEEDRSEMKRDPKEEVSLKRLLSPMNIEIATYKKPIRG